MTRLPLVSTYLRWLLARLGYVVRPYDLLADRRRWFWQRRTRCVWFWVRSDG